ncbi:MAG: MarR family winged helix-turn-helix transcriptional regulator [Pseudorhodoplanes sp.]
MQRAGVSALESHLGYWLRFVSNQVSQAFAEKLKAQDVSVAEWVVMRELYDGERAPSALAGRIGMTRGAITKIADRLIAKSLAARPASEVDGRPQLLALTRQGRTLVPKLAAIADRNDAEFFDHLAPKERAVVEAAMKSVVQRLGLKTLPVD